MMTILWPTGPSHPTLPAQNIHLWCAHLSQPTIYPQLTRLLSTDEQARANRFVFETDREKYATGRGLLRLLLARYLHVDPRQIAFSYGPQNKPALPGDPPPLFFNLAHSGNLVVYAISANQRLGVDLEVIRPLDDMDGIARRFFAPAEYTDLQSVPPAQRMIAFYHCWTRKEAFLKATGDGLTRPLNQFVVSLRPEAPARLLYLTGDPQAPHQWQLYTFSPAADYVGAVAVATSMPVTPFTMDIGRLLDLPG